MELPFAVESPERTSQLLPPLSTGDAISDDGNSLVTASSGSFLGSSTGTGGTTPPVTHHHPHHHSGRPQQATNVNHAMTPNTVVTHSNSRHPPSVVPIQQQQPAPQHHGHPHGHGRGHPPPNNHHLSSTNQQRAIPVVAPLPTSAPRPPPARSSNGGGITSGLNIFGNLRGWTSKSTPSSTTQMQQQQQQHSSESPNKATLETVDFTTYVNVSETDADEWAITLDGQLTAVDGLNGPSGDDNEKQESRDILTLLLSGAAQQSEGDCDNESLVRQCEEANQAACQAAEAKREGDLTGALEAHAQAAKQFHEAAVLIKDRNVSMANSLLLLSQTQAKSALALKRIVKQQPLPYDSNKADSKNPRSKIITQKDRLRAAVRGALVTRNEEEMSDSAFLGKATKGPMTAPSGTTSSTQVIDGSSSRPEQTPSSASGGTSSNAPQHNPVDDMMELERQLKDMDLTLELGNSIASLDLRTQSRLKSSSIGVDGSFMVVPGSQSYMSSSNMWAPAPSPSHPSSSSTKTGASRSTAKAASSRATAAPPGTASVRARANRVQNLLGASTNHPRSPPHGQPQTQHQQAHQNNPGHVAPPSSGLESSWWGTSSTTSQVLTSSVISLGASSINPRTGHEGGAADTTPANTKQLMRLMDALKTLGDENANLLREVEEAEAARMEAKAAKEQMARFKHDYSQKFDLLKKALKKFRENNPEPGHGGGDANIVMNSDYMRNASTTEQLQRQEQLIRKLTADLKKEKEESHKKDMALQKYEAFYREVKARSAAKQRQRETSSSSHQRPPQAVPPKSGARKTGHR